MRYLIVNIYQIEYHNPDLKNGNDILQDKRQDFPYPSRY